MHPRPFPSEQPAESADSPTGSASRASTAELEPAWRATQALLYLESEPLLALMLRPSFRLPSESDYVPVRPCLNCGDGGLRTAGSVRTRAGREPIQACDTCGAVEIGGRLHSPPQQ